MSINQSHPNDQVVRCLSALQAEVENFVLRMAAEFPQRKEQLIFLINNYDMLLAVLAVSVCVCTLCAVVVVVCVCVCVWVGVGVCGWVGLKYPILNLPTGLYRSVHLKSLRNQKASKAYFTQGRKSL